MQTGDLKICDKSGKYVTKICDKLGKTTQCLNAYFIIIFTY